MPLSVIPGKLALPPQIVSVPDFCNVGSGIVGLTFLTKGGTDLLLAGLLATLSIMLSDFFDTAGTFTALGTEAGLVDDNGNLRENEDRAYLVDSLGALAGRRCPARRAPRPTSRAAPASPRAAGPG